MAYTSSSPIQEPHNGLVDACKLHFPLQNALVRRLYYLSYPAFEPAVSIQTTHIILQNLQSHPHNALIIAQETWDNESIRETLINVITHMLRPSYAGSRMISFGNNMTRESIRHFLALLEFTLTAPELTRLIFYISSRFTQIKEFNYSTYTTTEMVEGVSITVQDSPIQFPPGISLFLDDDMHAEAEALNFLRDMPRDQPGVFNPRFAPFPDLTQPAWFPGSEAWAKEFESRFGKAIRINQAQSNRHLSLKKLGKDGNIEIVFVEIAGTDYGYFEVRWHNHSLLPPTKNLSIQNKTTFQHAVIAQDGESVLMVRIIPNENRLLVENYKPFDSKTSKPGVVKILFSENRLERRFDNAKWSSFHGHLGFTNYRSEIYIYKERTQKERIRSLKTDKFEYFGKQSPNVHLRISPPEPASPSSPRSAAEETASSPRTSSGVVVQQFLDHAGESKLSDERKLKLTLLEKQKQLLAQRGESGLFCEVGSKKQIKVTYSNMSCSYDVVWPDWHRVGILNSPGDSEIPDKAVFCVSSADDTQITLVRLHKNNPNNPTYLIDRVTRKNNGKAEHEFVGMYHSPAIKKADDLKWCVLDNQLAVNFQGTISPFNDSVFTKQSTIPSSKNGSSEDRNLNGESFVFRGNKVYKKVRGGEIEIKILAGRSLPLLAKPIKFLLSDRHAKFPAAGNWDIEFTQKLVIAYDIGNNQVQIAVLFQQMMDLFELVGPPFPLEKIEERLSLGANRTSFTIDNFQYDLITMSASALAPVPAPVPSGPASIPFVVSSASASASSHQNALAAAIAARHANSATSLSSSSISSSASAASSAASTTTVVAPKRVMPKATGAPRPTSAASARPPIASAAAGAAAAALPPPECDFFEFHLRAVNIGLQWDIKCINKQPPHESRFLGLKAFADREQKVVLGEITSLLPVPEEFSIAKNFRFLLVGFKNGYMGSVRFINTDNKGWRINGSIFGPFTDEPVFLSLITEGKKAGKHFSINKQDDLSIEFSAKIARLLDADLLPEK